MYWLIFFEKTVFPKTIIIQTENTVNQTANMLETDTVSFETILNKYNDATGKTTVTSNGYIEMPEIVQQQFIKIINEVENLLNSSSASFTKIYGDVSTLEKSVAAAADNKLSKIVKENS